jgi:C-methyltransferase C-terminal domain/Putative zinc binding domain/Methyltransferase domain
MTAPQPFRSVEACRICGSSGLHPVLDLGTQALTGVFPRTADAVVTAGPLELVKCLGDEHACGLVQLRHTYDPGEMYGSGYGYRSGLNRAMVSHLSSKVESLLERSPIGPDDVVLDIGSNDGTTLSFYPKNASLIGIDPTAGKFGKYYGKHIEVVVDFFSAETFFRASRGKKAKIVTSISMFYDLERPLDFMRQVHDVLADGGIWHFEQSYLPSMLAAGSYDTVCHEHVEYYALGPIVWMADRVGLSIVDVSLNDVNGGSFAVTAVKAKPGATRHAAVVGQMLHEEDTSGLSGLEPFTRFARSVRRHKDELHGLLEKLTDQGKRVFGMGASTKGNVILQYCEIGPRLLPCIAEVNEDKFGCFTPGTAIPIVSEDEAMARAPDVFLVLPWHFRENLIRRAAPRLAQGLRLLFPLPKIDFFPALASS